MGSEMCIRDRAGEGGGGGGGDNDAGEPLDAALVIGADGIRSTVRAQLLAAARASVDGARAAETVAQITLGCALRYLGLIVILGRAPCVHALAAERHIWEVVDGRARLYGMPFDGHSTMWQLSFALPLERAQALARAGGDALLDEAARVTSGWCEPVAQLLRDTRAADVTGYPAYDRPLPEPAALRAALGERCVLLGDALHPMSPFKGQGANQALLDGLELARALARVTALGPLPPGLREPALPLHSALGQFEAGMIARARVKVDASARAAQFLHSPAALAVGDCTRAGAAAGGATAIADESD